MRIVQFGAGNIGRGAIPEIFHDIYTSLTFIDPFPGIVTLLNQIPEYKIIHDHTVVVKNYNAILMANTSAVLDVLNQTDLITTACGFNNLESIADLLNQMTVANDKKINVVCFENNIRPSSHLKSLVKHPENFCFIDCTIDRVVPKQITSEPTLDLKTESYLKVIIEDTLGMQTSWFKNCEIVNDLENYISLKLFGVNGFHFVIAILTYNHGLKYIHEGINSQMVLPMLNTYMEILETFLVEKYKFDQHYIHDFIHHNLNRFANALLNDECVRVARNACLKLSIDNRIIPVFKYFFDKPDLQKELQQKLINILQQLYNYNNPEDQDSVNIQKFLKQNSLEDTILHFSNLKIKI